jgi:hypothetical protein
MTDEVGSKESKMRGQALREFVNRHIGSTTILAAVGAVLDAQATGTPLHPTIQFRIDEVLEALKIDSMTEGVNAADLGRMLAEIRSMCCWTQSCSFTQPVPCRGPTPRPRSCR